MLTLIIDLKPGQYIKVSFKTHDYDKQKTGNNMDIKTVCNARVDLAGGRGLGHPFLNFCDPPLVCSRFLPARKSLFNKTLTLPKRILTANKCCIEARNV